MLFAGKGGVGKTTCAAATAVAAAGAGARTLVVSTDPAHSLGDVLGTPLSSGPHAIRLPASARGTLHAAEIDARRAFRRWLAEHQYALADILEHGTWLDRDDIHALLALPIPGIDELLGLIEIARLAARHGAGSGHRGSSPRAVVVDTAPTGHTLRLLAAPDTVEAVAHILDGLQEEHRVIRQQIARVARPEAADRLIELLARQAQDTARLLRDSSRTALHWVTVPEEMALAESEDGIAALEAAGIRVTHVVVNRLLSDGPRCPVCDPRRGAQYRVVSRIVRRLGKGRLVRTLPDATREPRGIAALTRIGGLLTSERNMPATTRSALGQPTHSVTASASVRVGASTVTPESLDVFQDARLLFVGGKGGVGKTTIAATLAVRLARASSRPVLLLSTDPAHSLADVLLQPIGDQPIQLRHGPNNLHVRALDARAALASRRERLKAALDEIGATFGAEDVTGPAGNGTADLLELAPPGIDELLGMLSVVEAQERYPLVIVDTAPTGHALRLLETPEAALDWVHTLLRVLLKYRTLVRPGQLAEELVDLGKSIRGFQRLLQSSSDTRFLVVTRAADVPLAETVRLVGRLRRLRLAIPAVIANAMTLAPGRCPRCRATAASEARALAALVRRARGWRWRRGRGQEGAGAVDARLAGRRKRVTERCVIIQTPLAAPPPRGMRELERWAAQWNLQTGKKS